MIHRKEVIEVENGAKWSVMARTIGNDDMGD